jgi:hypothetical protein
VSPVTDPVWSIVITSLLAVLICVYAAAFYVVTSSAPSRSDWRTFIHLFNWRKALGPGEPAACRDSLWFLGVSQRST